MSSVILSAQPAFETIYNSFGNLLIIRSSLIPPCSLVKTDNVPWFSLRPWISATTKLSRHLTRSLPCNLNCSMCETSKIEAWDLVWWWELRTPSLYWTGIDHPQKGTIFPPWLIWKSYRTVLFKSSCNNKGVWWYIVKCVIEHTR